MHDPHSRLKQTQYTQPALYTVNALTWRAYAVTRANPTWLIGHSLGEYNALLAAGVFDFATGLRLVCKRGELMAAVQGGSMAAVIGLDETHVHEVLKQKGLHQVDIANINTDTQLVISGPQQAVEQACDTLQKTGARRIVPLPVSGAFHSRSMRTTQQEFADYIQQFSFQRSTHFCGGQRHSPGLFAQHFCHCPDLSATDRQPRALGSKHSVFV